MVTKVVLLKVVGWLFGYSSRLWAKELNLKTERDYDGAFFGHSKFRIYDFHYFRLNLSLFENFQNDLFVSDMTKNPIFFLAAMRKKPCVQGSHLNKDVVKSFWIPGAQPTKNEIFKQMLKKYQHICISDYGSLDTNLFSHQSTYFVNIPTKS